MFSSIVRFNKSEENALITKTPNTWSVNVSEPINCSFTDSEFYLNNVIVHNVCEIKPEIIHEINKYFLSDFNFIEYFIKYFKPIDESGNITLTSELYNALMESLIKIQQYSSDENILYFTAYKILILQNLFLRFKIPDPKIYFKTDIKK